MKAAEMPSRVLPYVSVTELVDDSGQWEALCFGKGCHAASGPVSRVQAQRFASLHVKAHGDALRNGRVL